MECEEVELRTNEEYRIEVPAGKQLRIMVVAGLAEVRGQELLSDRWYTFCGIATAVSTFTGAKLRIDGTAELRYVGRSALAPAVFGYFDRVVQDARVRRILVVGRGRSTFCATLANYFVRTHRPVRFTETDPGSGDIFPGVVGSVLVESIVDYRENFRLNNPLCFFYGSTEIENMELYDIQAEALIRATRASDAERREEARGGEPGAPAKEEAAPEIPFEIILAPTLSVDLLNALAKRFQVDEAVVVGDERLFNIAQLVIPKVFVENGGFAMQPPNTAVSASIARYFGGVDSEYTPCSFVLRGPSVVRIGEEHAAPDSALPLGGSRRVGRAETAPAVPVENSVLAISEATCLEDVPVSPVAGFIVLLDEKKLRVLCTQPRLPKCQFLIQGSLKYVEY